MHVDHELVEFVPIDEQEYEEVIEEYEEEILMQEEVLKPSLTDWADNRACPRQAPVHNPYFK